MKCSEFWKMKIRTGLMAAVLLILIVLELPGCGPIEAYKESKAQAEEEAHQKALEEVGAMNRARQEKRQAFMRSPLHEAGVNYIQETLEELMPGCVTEISLEPGDYREASEEELQKVPESKEEGTTFFDRAELSFNVNHWDYYDDPKELCTKLMDRGISGEMNNDEYYDDRWIINARDNKLELYVRPGV